LIVKRSNHQTKKYKFSDIDLHLVVNYNQFPNNSQELYAERNQHGLTLEAIQKMGGTVIVQDDKSAEFPGMPSAAIKTGNVDFILPLAEISSALLTLVMPHPDL
jgi:hypothetical protein